MQPHHRRTAAIERAALSFGALCLATASSAVGPLAVDELGVDLSTTYFWRGYEVVDHPALQPLVNLTLRDAPLSLTAWGSLTLGDHNNHKPSDEIDLTLAVAEEVTLGRLDLGLETGAILYTFPEAPRGTRRSAEAFVACSPDLPLSPTLSYAYDFDQWDASYLAIALAPELPLRSDRALAVTPSLGFGDSDQPFGFQDATLSLATTFAWRGLDWTPTLGLTRASHAINANRGGVWGTVGVRFGGVGEETD